MIEFISNSENHKFLFVFLFLSGILLLFGRYYATNSVMGGDAVLYFSQVRSLAIDKDLDLKNEYQRFYNEISPFTGNRKIPSIPDDNSVTGRIPNKYPVGSALALCHFFLQDIYCPFCCKRLGFPSKPMAITLFTS